MTTVYARLQSRRDTAANWTAANPVLAEGEIGFITDTKAAKIGDGVTAWNDLLTRPSQEQLVAVQAAAEQAAGDAQQRLTATVAAQTATETARDETQTLRDQTYGYKQDVASAIVYQDLASIAASKNLTMVAGFIYDTRLDTDGGAWRERCNGTSWYNEGLNTATRGSRRDHPSLVVGIAEATNLWLFDADDPSAPMWKVIPVETGKTIKSVAAYNGIIAFGIDVGVVRANFPAGTIKRRNNAGREHYLDFTTGQLVSFVDGFGAIANNNVNGVAMTVLPDAPVDPATGLQVPTIAVATDGGASVIRHDGTVVTASTFSSAAVAFESGDLWSVTNAEFFGAQLVRGPLFDIAGYGDRLYTMNQGNSAFPKPSSYFFTDGITGFGERDLVLRDAVGISMLHMGKSETGFNFTWPTAMLHEVRSDFVTGWQPGDIRGAFLASTDQTDLVASGELVTNGDFASNDLTGWSATASADASTGELVITADGATGQTVDQVISTVAGVRYRISINKISGAGINTDLYLRVGSSVGGYDLVNASAIGTVAAGIYSWEFFATGATANIRVMNNSSTAGRTVTVDDISVERVDDDRSSRRNSLIVKGTVPRAPVATGAELVAYGPFSATNYLEQPYNAEVDFSTGDFCAIGWIKGGSSGRTLFTHAEPGSLNSRYGIYIPGDIRAYVTTNTGSTKTVTVAAGVPSEWSQFVFLRRSGVLETYFNGVLVNTLANTDDLSNPLAKLIVGAKSDLTAGYDGSMALLRIGATAPTAAQIAKIYRDERCLFQPGAACTLYGTSDAVTALAHDPVTGLLHAGTSAGRSDFDGLIRVGNTTTPVAKAIAASGGMILEG